MFQLCTVKLSDEPEKQVYPILQILRDRIWILFDCKSRTLNGNSTIQLPPKFFQIPLLSFKGIYCHLHRCLSIIKEKTINVTYKIEDWGGVLLCINLHLAWKNFFGYFLGLNLLILFVNYFCLQTKVFLSVFQKLAVSNLCIFLNHLGSE